MSEIKDEKDVISLVALELGFGRNQGFKPLRHINATCLDFLENPALNHLEPMCADVSERQRHKKGRLWSPFLYPFLCLLFIIEDNMTLFDKILAGEIPAQVVYEDDKVMAFRDINPQAPVHVLVIPKMKVARFQELPERDDAEVGVFFSRVAKVARELGLEKGGYRVVVNNGRDGQQTVEYLHAHILGGRGLTWPPG